MKLKDALFSMTGIPLLGKPWRRAHNVSNYTAISLLNVDIKLFAKVLAIKSRKLVS